MRTIHKIEAFGDGDCLLAPARLIIGELPRVISRVTLRFTPDDGLPAEHVVWVDGENVLIGENPPEWVEAAVQVLLVRERLTGEKI